MHRAALTCGGENWYLEANTTGITPPKRSWISEQAQTCNSREKSVRLYSVFREIS